MSIHYISKNKLTLHQLEDIVENKQLALSEDSSILIQKCRTYLDEKLKTTSEPIYGINTGFGGLYDKSISEENLGVLQRNLVMSHACGFGDEAPQEIVKLMLLLKIQGVSQGHSGVQLATVQRMIDFYNHDILPVVYQQGSLGASGDLAPLAHLALPLLGLGEVYYQGKKQSSESVLKQYNWNPIELQSKEGLALLNGTQFMSAYGCYMLLKGNKLSYLADKIGSLSLDVFDGRMEPFDVLIHQIRAHKGQLETAKNISQFIKGSELMQQTKTHIQDPYSFRCMPQVHGASKDGIDYVSEVFTTEINSVTDNPTIFPDEDKIISAGNFHGQPLAVTLDFLSIVLAELASISERRTYKLIGGYRELPRFLVANPGLDSGFMIPQYTAASIISQNKQLCTPASVDTIDSSNGQEDHVSMGANAATKCYKVLENVGKVLAIELMNAAQALEFRRPLKTSEILENFNTEYRKVVPFMEKDRYLHVDMQASWEFLKKQ